MAKESKQMVENAIEETQQTIAKTHDQRLAVHSQIGESQKHIEMFRAQLKTAKAEVFRSNYTFLTIPFQKATADQAKSQRSKQEAESALSLEQKTEFRSKLDAQRAHANQLEDRVEELEKQKVLTFNVY
jgi:phage shock protein A